MYNHDGLLKSIIKPASLWDDNKELKITFKTTKNIKRIVLGNELIPDSNPDDNEFEIE